LNAKHVFIRAGELLVGTENDRFRAKANIKLYGEKDAEHIVYTAAVEAGNKMIANVGLVSMYG